MRPRIERWANWSYDNWRILLVPVVVCSVLFGAYKFATEKSRRLYDRTKREEVFNRLTSELREIPLPERSAINKSRGHHKASIVLVTTRYRSEARPEEFLATMDANLRQRGWSFWRRGNDGSAALVYHYCRGQEDATLLLESKSFIASDSADYWVLNFSGGMRTKPLFGSNQLPEGCMDVD